MDELPPSKRPMISRALLEAHHHRISPERFRELVCLDDDPRPIAKRLCDWQLNDFRALDDSWKRIVGYARTGPLRAWIERPRGHAKTADTAAMITWALVASDRPVSGLAAAADRDQAAFLRRAIGRLVDANSQRLSTLSVTRHAVRNTLTGSELRVISSDAASSYGELVDFVICDELCHWLQPDLWYSLISTAAKRSHCLLVVLSNAGVGRGWQWSARESARVDPNWHFSTLTGVHAPWITDDAIAEQRRLLPEPVFRRLWLNEWQDSDGDFISLAEVEACRDDSLRTRKDGEADIHYVAAIDYGEKHDYTAAVVAHHDGERVVIDRLDVAVPKPGGPIPTRWVDDWISRQIVAFSNLHIWVDEYQLLGVIQKWQHTVAIERFEFGSGRGNHLLAVALRQRIVNRTIAWPPSCGSIATEDGSRDDLEIELAALRLQQSVSGRLRFGHATGGHDDRAFVVAVAALKLAEESGPEWIRMDGSWM